MSKLRDAVYGFAVGDALGVPFEFRERDTFKCEGMTGYGTHYQHTGLDSFWKTWIASSIANEIAREENKKLRAEEIVEDE